MFAYSQVDRKHYSEHSGGVKTSKLFKPIPQTALDERIVLQLFLQIFHRIFYAPLWASNGLEIGWRSRLANAVAEPQRHFLRACRSSLRYGIQLVDMSEI